MTFPNRVENLLGQRIERQTRLKALLPRVHRLGADHGLDGGPLEAAGAVPREADGRDGRLGAQRREFDKSNVRQRVRSELRNLQTRGTRFQDARPHFQEERIHLEEKN